MGPKFRKLEIFENIEAGGGFGHQQSRIFFAGANFIASRRRGLYSKCFVEWLHRREIASVGEIVHTNELVQSVLSRPLGRISVAELYRSRKSFAIIQLQYY